MTTADAAKRIRKLTEERSKQVSLYNSIPDKKEKAARSVARRINNIDKKIVSIQKESDGSGGVPLWVWLALALVAAVAAWAGAYFAGQEIGL
ncbi:MAG: hypothetical protein QNJ84_06370 [Alphaproteobacteria bacterium]|nr:hypothetical protein [Alphaproteobacteria bacterium]